MPKISKGVKGVKRSKKVKGGKEKKAASQLIKKLAPDVQRAVLETLQEQLNEKEKEQILSPECSEFLKKLELYPIRMLKALMEKLGRAMCPTKRGSLGLNDSVFVEVEDQKMESFFKLLRNKELGGNWSTKKGNITQKNPKGDRVLKRRTMYTENMEAVKKLLHSFVGVNTEDIFKQRYFSLVVAEGRRKWRKARREENKFCRPGRFEGVGENERFDEQNGVVLTQTHLQ